MQHGDRARAAEALALSREIRPFLARRGPELQGAILADLVSVWLAGHAPPLREIILADWIKAVRELIPASEAEIFGDSIRPPGWEKTK